MQLFLCFNILAKYCTCSKLFLFSSSSSSFFTCFTLLLCLFFTLAFVKVKAKAKAETKSKSKSKNAQNQNKLYFRSLLFNNCVTFYCLHCVTLAFSFKPQKKISTQCSSFDSSFFLFFFVCLFVYFVKTFSSSLCKFFFCAADTQLITCKFFTNFLAPDTKQTLANVSLALL